MSIIYDALKKIESKKNHFANSQVNEETNSFQENEKIKSKNITKKEVIFLSGVVLLIMLSGVLFFTSEKRNQAGIPSVTNKRISTQKTKKVSAKNAKLIKKHYKGFILEGIIYDEQAPFAIINSEMLKPLDKIGNYVVEEITQETVILINAKDSKKVRLALPF